MRLVTFSVSGSSPQCGLASGDTVVPLQAASIDALLGAPDLRAAVDATPRGAALPRASVTLHAPLRPAVVVAPGPAVGDGLERHREFYLKSAHTVIGATDTIPYRAALGKLSYRAQLGLVLRPTARHTPADRVLDGLLGVVVAADLMSVDLLRPAWEGTMWHTRYGESGSFDGSCPIGSELVTADEIRLGELWLSDPCGEAPVDLAAVADQLAYVARWMALGPDVLVLAGSTHGPVFGREASGEPVVRFDDAEPRVGPGDRVRVRSSIGAIDALIAAHAGRS